MHKEEKSKKLFQEIDAEVEQEERLKPISLSELMSKEFKGTEWLIESLIPRESITAISGAPASFKTWICLDLAIKVSEGNKLFDKFNTTQAGVLIVDEENGERLLHNRIKNLLEKDFNLPIHVLSYKNFKLQEQHINHIISFASNHEVKLIIFDSLVRIHNADENDATKMARVFDWLKKLVKEGLTVVFTHHNRKQGAGHYNPAQDMRGSSDILAALDCHLAIGRKPQEDYLTITQTKLRQGEEAKPFKLNILSDDDSMRFEFNGEVDEVQNKKEDFTEAIKGFLEQENRPLYKKELFDKLKETDIKGGHSTFKMAIQEMIHNNELFEQKGAKNKIFLSLTPFEENPSFPTL